MLLTNDEIRSLLMQHGFTIKPGHADLKSYVFNAARAIENAALEKERAPKVCCGNYDTCAEACMPRSSHWQKLCAQQRKVLDFASEHLSSDWPERCQEIVRRAREVTP